MAHPFEAAHRKVARAKEHISNLKGETFAFFQAHPYIRVTETDPEDPRREIHKLQFTKGLPDLFYALTSDALHNLRDSLDNAGFALAMAAGNTHPLHAAFPFGGSAAEFENSLGRSKDIPKEFHSLFRSYGPYKGGTTFFGRSAG